MGASGLALTKNSDFSAHSFDPCIRFHPPLPKAVRLAFPMLNTSSISYLLIFSQKTEQPHLLDPPFLMSPDTPNSTRPFSNGTRIRLQAGNLVNVAKMWCQFLRSRYEPCRQC
jgi:hypothetical protein